jgi:2-alkyl-3-oxoalkanoate reductase
MRLAVTGATGFVGGALCRAAVARGWQVTAFGRRAAADPDHIGGAAYVGWDVGRGPFPDPPEVDAVAHCAAQATDAGSSRQVWAANMTGTRHVLASFPRARLVHLSTASVYDPFQPTVRGVESDAPVRRYLNPYAASKAAAERVVRNAVAAGREAVVLRPHAIYGPNDTTLLPRLLANVRAGRLLAVGDGRPLISVTHVDNLVDACLLAITGPVRSGVFNVADDGVLTVDEALRGLLRGAGVRVRLAYVPTWLARPLAVLSESVRRVRDDPRPVRLNRYVISQLAMERTLDISAARRELRYRPRGTSFEGVSAGSDRAQDSTGSDETQNEGKR